MKTAQLTTKPKIAQPPATSKTADELLADQMAIDAELEALPARIQQAKDLAADSIDDKTIASALATAEELKQKETTLKIKRWHARRSYLVAAHEEARAMGSKSPDEVSKAREELSAAEQSVKQALATRDVADRKFKTVVGQWRAAAMTAQQLQGDLQRLEQERPQL